MRRIRIRGVLHTVTTDASGNDVYDPPLEQTTERLFSKNCKSFKEGIKEGRIARLRMTDTDFHRGRKTIRDQFQGDEAWLRRFDKEYRKQTGTSLPLDGVWMGQLAENQFDAKAVIRPGEGHAEVKKLIKRHNDKQQKMLDAPPVRLAEDIVKEKVALYRNTEEFAKTPERELREYVVERHGQKV